MRLLLTALILALSLVNPAQAKPLSTTSHEYYKAEIKKILVDNGYYTKDMYMLLLGTMAAESDMGRYNKQRPGPALGIYQMEPATQQDIWKNYLPAKKEMRKKIEASMWPMVPKKTQLQHNIKYATLMAVAQYTRACDRKNINVPKDQDPWSLAWMWKMAYNTKNGRGTTTHFFQNYKTYVDAKR